MACPSSPKFSDFSSGFTAHIDAQEAGLLIFTIPYDKGFTAHVNGQESEIFLCDIAFMGVWVEPGEHHIEFTYRTRGLTLGVAMSLCAGIALAAYVLLCRAKKIRFI